jgi:hypothetical protein
MHHGFAKCIEPAKWMRQIHARGCRVQTHGSQRLTLAAFRTAGGLSVRWHQPLGIDCSTRRRRRSIGLAGTRCTPVVSADVQLERGWPESTPGGYAAQLAKKTAIPIGDRRASTKPNRWNEHLVDMQARGRHVKTLLAPGVAAAAERPQQRERSPLCHSSSVDSCRPRPAAAQSTDSLNRGSYRDTPKFDRRPDLPDAVRRRGTGCSVCRCP